jgi:hypothetical protein
LQITVIILQILYWINSKLLEWKSFSTKSKHPDFANGVFVIGTSATEILMLEEEPNKLILANTYLMSAYIADFMNENQLDSLVLADIDRLVHEARRAFSSINTPDSF